MPVSKPGKMPFKPGPFGRPVANKPVLYHQLRSSRCSAASRGSGHKGVNADLNLTSMIDYLVITVVFALAVRDAAADAVVGEPRGADEHADNLISAPIISISEQAILMDGQRVANPRGAHGGAHRPPLRAPRPGQARVPRAAPGRDLPGRHRLPDRPPHPWSIIKAVARTCSQAGYTRLNFAVTKGPRRRRTSGRLPRSQARVPLVRPVQPSPTPPKAPHRGLIPREGARLPAPRAMALLGPILAVLIGFPAVWLTLRHRDLVRQRDALAREYAERVAPFAPAYRGGRAHRVPRPRLARPWASAATPRSRG